MSETNEQINRAIHEKVAGKCWHEFEGDPHNFKLRTCKKCPKRKGWEASLRWQSPDYAGDISAAFDVVGKLESEGWHWCFESEYCTSEGDEKYFASFYNKTAAVFDFNESLPKAICKAALKAKGIEL